MATNSTSSLNNKATNSLYNIYANYPNSACYNESSDRIRRLKYRVILNDTRNIITASGLPDNVLNRVVKFPNYEMRNSSFRENSGCQILK
jgi:hypothetical protein